MSHGRHASGDKIFKKRTSKLRDQSPVSAFLFLLDPVGKLVVVVLSQRSHGMWPLLGTFFSRLGYIAIMRSTGCETITRLIIGTEFQDG